MDNPIVAIVGRPNVGKSTLFNKIVGKRISIVDNLPGVTRDRIYADAEWLNRGFTLIDTGGIEVDVKNEIHQQVKYQAEVAINTADVIIFLVDAKEGLTPSDQEVAELLRRSAKPIILAANKVDNFNDIPEGIYDFFALGFGEPVMISSALGLNIGDLLDKVVECFQKIEKIKYDEDVIKVAVVGKPNVGKSSLINAILGEERVIVSDIPGTTRDAVDTPFEKNGQKYVFIDTAGIRKKSKISESIEYYSVLRGFKAIERADIVLIVIDALEGITEQDKKISGFAHDTGKASIIVVNKWDLIEKDHTTMDKYRKDIRNKLAFMQYAPIIFVSVKTGKRVTRILDLVKFVSDQYSMRIQTSILNRIISDAVAVVEPPSFKGRKLKVYYVTQSSTRPPTFNFFVNDPNLIHFSYQRYLENQLRASFGLEGTPLKFYFKKR
ncbi:MAG: GTPase [Thermosediminibacterales bacterium]|nr:GTPase [Thermosediminibacterales bacterium]